MTSEDLKSELDKQPFIPIRPHLVSGKTIDIRGPGIAYMLQNAVMIVHDPRQISSEDTYDLVALRNFEQIEQLSE